MNAVAEQENKALSPMVIGAPIDGGFFAGVINVDGNAYGVLVAPKDGGETSMAWASSRGAVAGAMSYNDGAANTVAMAAAGSELAQWAQALHLNGCSDWYIPSRDELELIYRNLKPTERANYCSFRDGENPSSTPVGYPYTETAPTITSANHFKACSGEAFEPEWYWSSTQYAADPSDAWLQDFDSGNQYGNHKTYEGRARAVRRVAI